ncbi:MAG: B12-binding domain-containing radical SAM protein [Promethearchaeota archaeon]|nr:MAG: B12-binding domain-containing radical SAM protein [Candidatus Lokiarchaeota archaeon]
MKLSQKKIQRVVLVYPNFITGSITDKITLPALGLETIAANILDLADVKIINAKVRNLSLAQLMEEIYMFDPDIVGISCCFTIGIDFSLKVAQESKKQGYLTVLGGWHPNFVPSDLLKYHFVDIVVRGEGEITFRDIIQGKELEDIEGISYKKEGTIINNPDRPLIDDLDTLPIPARDLRHKDSQFQMFYMPVDAIETSRGCPHRCTFCNIHLFYRGTYRMKSPKRVIEELKIIENEKESALQSVFIVDDNFTSNMKRVEKICDLIIEEGIELDFMCQSRMDVIRRYPRIIQKMSNAGFWAFFCGIESFNQDSLDNIHKRVQLKDIIESIKILHKNNIVIVGSMLVGSRLEEKEKDTETMIQIVKNLSIDFPIYSIMTPLPGTKFRELLVENKYTLSNKWNDYNFTTATNRLKNLSKEKLEALLFKAYHNGYFKKNWMGTLLRLYRKKGLKYLLSNKSIHAVRDFLGFYWNLRTSKDVSNQFLL